jgi:hypothetical protein
MGLGICSYKYFWWERVLWRLKAMELASLKGRAREHRSWVLPCHRPFQVLVNNNVCLPFRFLKSLHFTNEIEIDYFQDYVNIIGGKYYNKCRYKYTSTYKYFTTTLFFCFKTVCVWEYVWGERALYTIHLFSNNWQWHNGHHTPSISGWLSC